MNRTAIRHRVTETLAGPTCKCFSTLTFITSIYLPLKYICILKLLLLWWSLTCADWFHFWKYKMPTHVVLTVVGQHMFKLCFISFDVFCEKIRVTQRVFLGQPAHESLWLPLWKNDIAPSILAISIESFSRKLKVNFLVLHRRVTYNLVV